MSRVSLHSNVTDWSVVQYKTIMNACMHVNKSVICVGCEVPKTTCKMSQCRQCFPQLEKSPLRTKLVAKHKDVLESKINDFRTISQKNALWETLSQEFN